MAISFTKGFGENTGFGSTVDAVPGSATAAGACLFAFVTIANNTAVSTLTDSASNTWTLAHRHQGGGIAWWTSEIWYCDNAASVGAAGWIRATRSGSSSLSIVAHEWDLDGQSIANLRTSGSAEFPNASTTTVSSAGSASVGDLAVAMMGSQNLTPTGVSSGWDARTNQISNPNVGTGSREIASAGTASITFSVSGSGDGSGALAVFELSGGGGGPVIPVFQHHYRQMRT